MWKWWRAERVKVEMMGEEPAEGGGRFREEERERHVWRKVGKKEREGRESDMVWWVYEKLYMCHIISG